MHTLFLRVRYWRIVGFFARVTFKRYFLGPFPAEDRFWASREPFRSILTGVSRSVSALCDPHGGVMIKVASSCRASGRAPPEITDGIADCRTRFPLRFLIHTPARRSRVRWSAERNFRILLKKHRLRGLLGQVHRARLLSGDAAEVGFEGVVVYNSRPGLNSWWKWMLSALRVVGNWLRHYRPVSEHADVNAM